MIILGLICLISIIYPTQGYFEKCDQFITMTSTNLSITINSPNYPYYQYAPGSSCRYYVRAPSGYQISLSCSIVLPSQSGACYSDILYVSTDANTTLLNAQYYCGSGVITATSLFNNIVFAYISNSVSSSGYFSCTATATPQACDCGWSVTSKIAGGTVTSSNEFISMTAIVYKSPPAAPFVFCGGTIIHYKYVLTAAHCFDSFNVPTSIYVLIGEQDYSSGTDTLYSDLLPISSYRIHEAYNSTTLINDIAIITMANDIQYSRAVGPACLPFNYANNNFENNYVNIAGWGSTAFGQPVSYTLRKATVGVIPFSYCPAYYPSKVFTTIGQLCTYDPTQDSCQYDSGGSVYLRGTKLYTIGIISYGFGCANGYPSVNTRVNSYLNWIQYYANVNYCVK